MAIMPQPIIEPPAERDPFAIIDGDPADIPCCRVCGCTQYEPCLTDRGPCFWIEPGLCSRCAGLADQGEED